MKILHLTLTAKPFKTMEQGLKDREYREYIQWIRGRLIDKKTGKRKHYDVVLFKNGYTKKSPYFAAKFKGFDIAKKNYFVNYKTGLRVFVKKGDFRIKLGSIIRKGNIDTFDLF